MKTLPRERLQYVFSKEVPPIVHIDPGETIVVETEDASSGRIRSPADIVPEKLTRSPYGNPVTGPIYVNGAEPEDTLWVKIEDIQCDEQGYTLFRDYRLPGLIKETRAKLVSIRDNMVIFSDRVRIPVRPLIGTIGTAPLYEAVSSLKPGTHGGNMDCPDVTVGSLLMLPVYVPGGLLALGDVHAAQGDAEFCGVGIEVRARVRLTVNLHQGHPPAMTWPRIETEDAIVTVASDKPLEKALELAFQDMILWLEEEHGFERGEALLLVTQVADGRVCQVVNPLFTVRCRFPKAYLKI